LHYRFLLRLLNYMVRFSSILSKHHAGRLQIKGLSAYSMELCVGGVAQWLGRRSFAGGLS